MCPARAALTAIASYLPDRVLTNEELALDHPDWSAEKIAEKTGIHSRHIAAEGEFTSELAQRAAEELLGREGIDRQKIDVLMLITVTPDYHLPFTAAQVHGALSLPSHIGAFDVSLGCSGFTYGLGVAGAMIESGRARSVLLLTADRFSVHTDEAPPGTRNLFGDAATASLIELQRSSEPVPEGLQLLIGPTKFGTEGDDRDLVVRTSGVRGFVGAESTSTRKPTLEMNGPAVFNFTLRVVGRHVADFLSENGRTIDEVDLFIFHQANEFMLEHLRRRLRIPKEKFVVHLSCVGNTMSSTIPLALEHAVDSGRLRGHQLVLLVGFGVGYSWGSVLLEVVSTPGGQES